MDYYEEDFYDRAIDEINRTVQMIKKNYSYEEIRKEVCVSQREVSYLKDAISSLSCSIKEQNSVRLYDLKSYDKKIDLLVTVRAESYVEVYEKFYAVGEQKKD